MSTMIEIMSDVLELPRTDRSYLAKKLLESLEEEEALSKHEERTIERRSQELQDGSVEGMSLEELKRSVQSKLA